METGANFSEAEFKSFQFVVYNRFYDLSVASSYEFLSLPWIAELLDAFFSCQEEFSNILYNYRANVSIPPLISSVTTGFLDNCAKALNICNASRNGLQKIRKCQGYLETLIDAVKLEQFFRTRQTLQEMSPLMLDDIGTGSVPSQNWFFPSHSDEPGSSSSPGPSRAWSQPDPCSAAEQLEFISTSRVQPCGGTGTTAADRIAVTIFTMGFILMFVLWVLVAAIPCQDRTIESFFTIPSQFSWGKLLNIIQGRIMDESNKEERRNSMGLMKEIHEIEKSVHQITDLVNSENPPVGVEKKWIVNDRVYELLKIHEACKKDQLDPVDRRLRSLFAKIWSCLIEGSEWLTFQSNIAK